VRQLGQSIVQGHELVRCGIGGEINVINVELLTVAAPLVGNDAKRLIRKCRGCIPALGPPGRTCGTCNRTARPLAVAVGHDSFTH
jgi:hypothetical protein